MALKPALVTVKIPEDGSYITLADATGDYSASNTGGFGAPNPEKLDALAAIIKIGSLKDLSVYKGYRLEGTEKDSLFSIGGIALPSDNFSPVATTSKFEDSIYNVLYNIVYAHANPITFTPGSNEFSLPSAEDVFLDAVGFVIPSYDPSVIFYVNKDELTSTEGKITSTFPDTPDGVVIEIVYEGLHKFLVMKEGTQCLQKDIALWAELGCEGTSFRDILKRYMIKTSIEYKFNRKLYSEAQVLVDKLQSYCENCCN